MKTRELLLAAKDAGFGILTPVVGQNDVYRFTALGLNCLLFITGANPQKDVTSLQLFVGITLSGLSLAKVNRWNLENRFAKAYVMDSGALAVDFDVLLFGDEKAALSSAFAVWCLQLSRLGDYFG